MKESLLSLILACTTNVSPLTISYIVSVESNYEPFAIHVNGDYSTPSSIQTAEQAYAVALDAISKGYTVDIGLMQINSNNLDYLDLSVIDAFDPCLNLKGGTQILKDNYQRAVKRYGEGQRALLAALSMYNTGDMQKGFANGYIRRYLEHSRNTVGVDHTTVLQNHAMDAPISIPFINTQKRNSYDQRQ